MEFASLHIFKTVVEEGGIIAAARKLHRTQSSVTVRIQQLEDSLGAALFIRQQRRLILSPAGEILLGYAERLLDLSDQARHAVRGDLPQGVLRIGTLESTAASRLPPLLSRYHGKHPAVRVELATNTTDGLVEDVLGRKYEAAFIAGHADAMGLQGLAAFHEELVIAAPYSHPTIASAQDVVTDTIISFPAGCAYRRCLQSWLADGSVIPEKALELSSYHAIVACVASGTGIAIVPKSVLETVRVKDSIAIYPLPEDRRQVTTYLIWRKGESSPALRALRDEIRQGDLDKQIEWRESSAI
ncbi:LysR family transcriptional regulator [Candidatus Entotheonella serta]|nr:LysR family transcriptional regulator [Candidatus Entotheonella serta]